MLKFLFFLIVLSISVALASGQVSESNEFTVRGVIHSLDATVFPGLRVRFKSERVDNVTLTDMEGRFEQRLSNGDYVVTIDGLSSSDFRAFIKVGKGNLNPNFLTFVVDWKNIDCLAYSRTPVPKIVSVVLPSHPTMVSPQPLGEVTVQIRISTDGIVDQAKAISGHPLLRAASTKAAEKFVFEADKTSQLRTTQLTFVFHWNSEAGQKLNRTNCPGRMVIPAPKRTILLTGS